MTTVSRPSSSKYGLVDPFVIFAGGTSAIASRLTVHPLDTLKVKIQTHPSSTPLPSIPNLIGRPVLPKLYAGLPVALGFSIPALAVYLTTYDAAKTFYASRLLGTGSNSSLDFASLSWVRQAPVFFLSGVTAEMVSGIIWTPMDVAKSRLQRGGEPTGNSATRLLKNVWRSEGYRGLWRGYWVSIAVFGPHISIYWALYEYFKTLTVPGYDPYSPSRSHVSEAATLSPPLPIRYAASSALAISISAVLTNPIEVVRTRWQTSGGRPLERVAGGSGGVKETIGGVVRALWKNGGWKAFTRGAGARVLYYIPSNAISMTTFEMLKQKRVEWGL